MPLSKTEICNLALGHLGTGQEIQNVETDQTQEAKVARRFYQNTLEEILSGYSWNWCKVYMPLQIVELQPNDEWAYSYRMPSDCLFFQRIWNGTPIDDEKTRIKYVESNDSSGRLILTNWGPAFSLVNGVNTVTDTDFQAIAEYTQNNPKAEAQMTPLFRSGFALMLSAWMAPQLPGVGAIDLREKNLVLGGRLLASAISRDANEVTAPFEMVSTLQKSRGGWGIGWRGNGWQAIPAEDFVP